MANAERQPMRELMVVRHLAAILTLPVVVTGVVPYLLVTPIAESDASPVSGFVRWALLLVGLCAMLGGLILVCVTVHYFATIGRGTLAPWDPTRRLVATGVYRHVRNPMISGVILILFGESFVLRSTSVLLWAIAVVAINAVYIPLVEEPGLKRRFGEAYIEYSRQVPRWIPRF